MVAKFVEDKPQTDARGKTRGLEWASADIPCMANNKFETNIHSSFFTQSDNNDRLTNALTFYLGKNDSRNCEGIWGKWT